jgi:hypothetical protein
MPWASPPLVSIPIRFVIVSCRISEVVLRVVPKNGRHTFNTESHAGKRREMHGGIVGISSYGRSNFALDCTSKTRHPRRHIPPA